MYIKYVIISKYCFILNERSDNNVVVIIGVVEIIVHVADNGRAEWIPIHNMISQLITKCNNTKFM